MDKNRVEKSSALNDRPFVLGSQVAPRENGGGGAGRTCLEGGAPCSSPFKIKVAKKFSTPLRFYFLFETFKKIYFPHDLWFSKKTKKFHKIK